MRSAEYWGEDQEVVDQGDLGGRIAMEVGVRTLMRVYVFELKEPRFDFDVLFNQVILSQGYQSVYRIFYMTIARSARCIFPNPNLYLSISRAYFLLSLFSFAPHPTSKVCAYKHLNPLTCLPQASPAHSINVMDISRKSSWLLDDFFLPLKYAFVFFSAP